MPPRQMVIPPAQNSHSPRDGEDLSALDWHELQAAADVGQRWVRIQTGMPAARAAPFLEPTRAERGLVL